MDDFEGGGADLAKTQRSKFGVFNILKYPNKSINTLNNACNMQLKCIDYFPTLK